MTPLEMKVAVEIIQWGAQFLFDAVNSEGNDLKADDAKKFSKSAMEKISDEAKNAIMHHLPRHLKL